MPPKGTLEVVLQGRSLLIGIGVLQLGNTDFSSPPFRPRTTAGRQAQPPGQPARFPRSQSRIRPTRRATLAGTPNSAQATTPPPRGSSPCAGSIPQPRLVSFHLPNRKIPALRVREVPAADDGGGLHGDAVSELKACVVRRSPAQGFFGVVRAAWMPWARSYGGLLLRHQGVLSSSRLDNLELLAHRLISVRL